MGADALLGADVGVENSDGVWSIVIALKQLRQVALLLAPLEADAVDLTCRLAVALDREALDRAGLEASAQLGPRQPRRPLLAGIMVPVGDESRDARLGQPL